MSFTNSSDKIMMRSFVQEKEASGTLFEAPQPIVDEIRWDEKAGLRTGCGVRSQVIDVL